MYAKWRRQVKDFINKAVRTTMRLLWQLGVSEVIVGYPKGIAQNRGGFLTVNVWTYSYLLERIEEVAWEYGIKVKFVNESWTSQTCPFHGTTNCGKRVKRGLFKCYEINKAFNADVAGAFNILRRVAKGVEPVLKALATPKTIFPITPSPAEG